MFKEEKTSDSDFEKLKDRIAKESRVGKEIIDRKRLRKKPLSWIVSDSFDACLFAVSPVSPRSNEYYYCFVSGCEVLELYIDSSIISKLYVVQSDFNVSDELAKKIKLAMCLVMEIGISSVDVLKISMDGFNNGTD